MAAQGAHLTSTAVADDDHPSIFEVLAQESLVLALQPALQHVFRVLAESNPHRYGWLYGHSDDAFAGLKLILESHYLKHYSASFSENFYGLKRVSTMTATTPSQMSDSLGDKLTAQVSQLSRQERFKSLIFLVVLPYVKGKCDKLYERLKEGRQHGDQRQATWRRTLCKAFLGVYPVMHFAWQSAMLGFQLAYILGKSRYHSPCLPLAGVSLHNMTEEDMESRSLHPPLHLGNKSVLGVVSALSTRSLAVMAVALSHGMSVGVFFLQFLEWWYASDQHAASLTALPTPPPLQAPLSDSVPKLTALCPLCHRVRVNDTALAVSGYVFCYTCIHNYIAKNGCCPVAAYPANLEQLVRLYLPDS